MIKNSLASISDVAIYPIISLLIFVSFFIILGIAVIRTNKTYIKHMEEMPLEEDSFTENKILN